MKIGHGPCIRRSLLVLLIATLLTVAQALELHFIDVGQGDSVLIRGPGGQTVLYDAGPSAGAVLTYLNEIGVESLDLVIASHADADHIGGLPEIVRAYRPQFFMDNGVPHTTDTYYRLLESVSAAGSQYLEPVAREIGLGEARLHVLPPVGTGSLGQNANSLGLIVEYGEFRAVLAGDADGRAFDRWLETHRDLLHDVQVYKASHHGSVNGDTARTMREVGPGVVVISVGAGNTYGHPSLEAQQLYAAVANEVYRTDLHGHVRIEAQDDASFTVSHGNENVPVLQFASQTLPDLAESSAVPPVAVFVECILFNPDGSDDGRERVTLQATEETDISGWSLADAADHTFGLPARTLARGERLEVRNPGQPVWNNDGDTAYLMDGQDALIDTFSYSGRGSRACR